MTLWSRHCLHRPITVSPHCGQLKVVLPLSTSRTPQDEHITALANIVDLKAENKLPQYNGCDFSQIINNV
jgi:hypothetical protein